MKERWLAWCIPRVRTSFQGDIMSTGTPAGVEGAGGPRNPVIER